MTDKTEAYARGLDKARRKLAPEAVAIGLDARRQPIDGARFDPDTHGWYPEDRDDGRFHVEVCEVDGRSRVLFEQIKYWAFKRFAGDPFRIYSGGRPIPWTQSIIRVWKWREYNDLAPYTPA